MGPLGCTIGASFQLEKIMYITFSTYSVFGSGASSAHLILDGTRVTRAYVQAQGWAVRSEDNGFVGDNMVNIPLNVILNAREIEYERGCIPGGTTKIKAGGRHFVKKFLKCSAWRKDPILENAYWRRMKADQMKCTRRRQKMYEWALQQGKVRLDENGRREWRVTFRLPDGSRGGRWDVFATDREIGYSGP
jgi:hypothetical protein